MKCLLSIFVVVCSTQVLAQSNEMAVLQLVRKALEEKKLPARLLNSYDSSGRVSRIVAIEKTPENALQEISLQQSDVSYKIWNAGDLLTHSAYWITPSNIEIKDNTLSFDFRTGYLSEEVIDCYEGKIKGKKSNDEWVLLKASSKKTQCIFDLKQ